MSQIVNEAQIVIIGAGAIGCSIAYHLAIRGADVLVVEADTIGGGTSTATHGLVWVQGKEPAEYMELNLFGAELHQRFSNIYDEDIGLYQPGGLKICLDDSELQEEINLLNSLKLGSKKYKARVLTRSELREMEPCVSNEIAGAIYSPHDGWVNPIKLVFNLSRLAKRQGARFLLRTPVLSIATDKRGVCGVDTANGYIQTETVVLSAGVGSAALVEPLPFKMPLEFLRGQLLVTEKLNRLLQHPTDAIVQADDGNLLLGRTYEEAGLDTSVTIESAVNLARNAIRTIPALKDTHIVRHFAGIRPMPADGRPYMGPVERLPGLFIAVSHSGITLAHVHGKAISELILDGKTDVPIGPYKPERYASGYQQ